MGWLLNTAEKATVDAFNQFIEDVVKKNEGREIYIWGASVRGTLLGMLLEKKGYSDFLFVDNDERKWGTNINKHLIISADELLNMRHDGYVIIPVEHYLEIRTQLLKLNMKEASDFYIIKSNLYYDFCREFFRKYNSKYLVLGETFLLSTLLDEKPMGSMMDDLYLAYGRDNMKILSIGCMGMEESYYYLKKQISLDMCSEKLWIFVNFETLTKHHHILPRVQHPDLAEMIQIKSDHIEPDLSKYIERARERALNYRLELKYSPQRTYVGEPDEEQVQKDYTRQQLLNQISEEYEECRYLSKILMICNEKKIDVSVIVVPINYQRVIDFFGDNFNNIHKNNINILYHLTSKYRCRFWDLSELLEKQFFETKVTLQDGIRQEGRRKIISCLKEYEK